MVRRNNKELGSALKISGAKGRLGWRLFGVGRFAESYETPDGEVDNTGFLSANGEASVGIRGTRSNTTLRFSHYGGEFKLLEARAPFNVPDASAATAAEEDGPERKLSDDRLQLVSDYVAGTTRLETKAQWQRHSLQEVSDDACLLFPTIPSCLASVNSTASAPATEMPAFDLLLNTGTLDVLAHHVLTDAIRGTAGLSGLYQKNDSRGPDLSRPDATVSSIGAFAFEEATLQQLDALPRRAGRFPPLDRGSHPVSA